MFLAVSAYAYVCLLSRWSLSELQRYSFIFITVSRAIDAATTSIVRPSNLRVRVLRLVLPTGLEIYYFLFSESIHLNKFSTRPNISIANTSNASSLYLQGRSIWFCKCSGTKNRTFIASTTRLTGTHSYTVRNQYESTCYILESPQHGRVVILKENDLIV